MAFPTIAATPTTGATTTGTSHTINLPSSIVSGELLILILAIDGAETTTWPAGYTAIIDEVQQSSILTTDVFYRIANGTEGSSISVTTGTNEIVNYITFRITDWHGTTPPEVSYATGNDSAPDPASETASWGGTEDNLFIAGLCYNDGRTAVNAWPTNYSSNQTNQQDGAPGGTGVAIATREVASDTENPAAFGLDSSETWNAFTIVVRPAAAGASTIAGRLINSIRLKTKIGGSLVG